MTVNEIMNLVRLYRKEPKRAIAGERAKQIRAELIKACRVPDGFKLVPDNATCRKDAELARLRALLREVRIHAPTDLLRKIEEEMAQWR